ncbi:hypothetical protein BJ684DRAFT_9990 [Piptocephalis cylindrospora]|uniref:AB hydrolase-1 domain-containing protein n=1 Tax=Piptocephalis cylindrospora TaxID=1907219 RepID=A0A4P9Y3G8_9FUNG|nr:hypothetical protein BJ684DRAFT_9990 [Piptocephalis cylindrospora]|eukprot:RKP13488.1 hypothetical protein BJ684DRAFT_9990 [Piptocephalis cylindrospora]
MLEALESRLGAPFPPGYNPKIRCIRLNYDPVHVVHRPFLVYLSVLTMDSLLKVGLRFMGFRRHGRLPRSLPRAIFPSLDSFLPKPIIFVHGIGIGILPYISFILRLVRTSSSAPPLYLVELSEVSMRLNLNPSPTIPVVVTEMAMALTERGHSQAVWVGHSLGSSVVAGACRWARDSVAATVFIDPICFLLHYPNVAWNFVHRRGVGADERFTEYFASRELSISRYISRDFQWWHACVFADQLPGGSNTSVYLSSLDALVPSALVKAYLEKNRVPTTIMPHGHAGFLFQSKWEIPISRQVLSLAHVS